MRSWFKKIIKIRAARAVLKLAFFYVAIKLVVMSVNGIMSSGLLSTVALEMNTSADLSLNDLHYSIQRSEQSFEEVNDNLLIINSGNLDRDNFRSELAFLLNYLSDFPVKTIALDVNFENDTSRIGTQELIKAVKDNPKLILAADTLGDKKYLDFGDNVKYGTVDFPATDHTNRRYYSANGTFAAQIAKSMGFSTDVNADTNSDLIINYVYDTLYTHNVLPEECAWDTLFERTRPGFKELPLTEIYRLDSACLSLLLKDKTILIGHVKNSCAENYYLDSEDKFAVPTDTKMLYRPTTMPGVMVHANAVLNMANPDVRFRCWSDQKWFLFFEEIVLLAYLSFLLFARVGKLLNILMMLLLTIPILYLVLLAMKHHIYIEVGTTLLQFLIFEELTEIIEPVYHKCKNALEKRKLLF